MVLIGVTITSATFMEQDKPTPVVVFELIKGIIAKKPPKLGKERTVRKTRRAAKRR